MVHGTRMGGLSIGVEEWRFGKELGRGRFGSVVVAERTGSGSKTKIAAKFVQKGAFVASEVEILAKVSSHPFVVDFHFQEERKNTIIIGMELCSCDLFTLMVDFPDEMDIQALTAQIASALDFVHQSNVIFGDLKPENVGISFDGSVRLLDFGLAVQLEDKHSKVVYSCGTMEYACPEMFKRELVSFEIDWWAFGVLLYELVFGDLPFQQDQRNTEEFVGAVCCEDLQPPFVLETSEQVDAFDLARTLLEKNVEDRIVSFKPVSEHRFFRSMKWSTTCRRADDFC